MRRKIPLFFSDNELGTFEFGMLLRIRREDCDDEDLRYERHVRKLFKGKVRCIEGVLILEDES